MMLLGLISIKQTRSFIAVIAWIMTTVNDMTECIAPATPTREYYCLKSPDVNIFLSYIKLNGNSMHIKQGWENNLK
jgi:hypothetical protein